MIMCWLFTMLCASFPVFASSGWFRLRRVCEDPFDYVCLSSSWTRSSSLRDFRQDDHTLEITTIFAMLVCSLLLCHCYDAYHLLASLPNCHVKPLTHQCPSKPLIGYVTALLSPSYSVVSCRWRLEFVPCSNKEQTSSSPATKNAIRRAEQSGNIAKQRFAGTRWVRGLVQQYRRHDKQVVGIVA